MNIIIKDPTGKVNPKKKDIFTLKVWWDVEKYGANLKEVVKIKKSEYDSNSKLKSDFHNLILCTDACCEASENRSGLFDSYDGIHGYEQAFGHESDSEVSIWIPSHPMADDYIPTFNGYELSYHDENGNDMDLEILFDESEQKIIEDSKSYFTKLYEIEKARNRERWG